MPDEVLNSLREGDMISGPAAGGGVSGLDSLENSDVHCCNCYVVIIIIGRTSHYKRHPVAHTRAEVEVIVERNRGSTVAAPQTTALLSARAHMFPPGPHSMPGFLRGGVCGDGCLCGRGRRPLPHRTSVLGRFASLERCCGFTTDT